MVSDGSRRVVRSVPGPGTGDEILITEDGTRWSVVRHLPPRQTGDEHGITDRRTVWPR